MKRNPKDRGYGYKKSYNYEDSIKESRQKLEDDFIEHIHSIKFNRENLVNIWR